MLRVIYFWCILQYFNTAYRTVKNFHEFRGFVAIHKVISTKFEGTGPLARQKWAIHESFLRKNRIFHQFAKFSPAKVSCYAVMCHMYAKLAW